MITDEAILDKVKYFGLLKYGYKQIVSILAKEVDLSEFKADFYNENSDVYQHYWSGKNSSDFDIDKSLYDEAKKGNVDAIAMLEARTENAILQQQVNELFGDE